MARLTLLKHVRVPAKLYGDGMAISLKNRKKIFKRDGWRCVVCGTSKRLTIDHIFPVCFGGQGNPGNLQTMCRKCNERKGNSIMGPWRICFNCNRPGDNVSPGRLGAGVNRKLELHKQNYR